MAESDNRVPDYDAIAARLLEQASFLGVSYRVTIEKQEKFVMEQQGDWVVLCEKANEGKKYGYAPSRPVLSPKAVTVFSQIVSDLDVASVVKAVNGIPSSEV